MRRVISVWLPHWPTDRLRRSPGAPPPERPLVTAAQDGNRRVIMAVDPAAASLGLRPGQAVAHAMAAVPGLTITDADPGADAASLERLARWCHRLTPLVAVDGADGLWLDVTGCAHLWDGEANLLAHLVDRLRQEGVSARAAIADTPGAAHAVARYGEGIVPPGAQKEAITALPIASLRLPEETVATLRRLGFEQVGHLARVPRALIARRFGAEPGRRLDQAFGALPEPIAPLAHEAKLQHRLSFLEPLLTAEALSEATAALLGPVCTQLERVGLGARRLDLLFERVDGTLQATRIGAARPSRNPRHLRRLLDEHLDKVEPGLGIEAMRLVVTLAEPLLWTQGDTGGDRDVSALVDRLANRLGPERVYRAAPVESDLPERAVRRIPPLSRPTRAAWPAPGPAPTRLLDPPRPVDAIAELPDHPPAAFIWRRHRHKIRRADGPERVYGEWWRADAERSAVRDYYRVEDETGRRFLLFREGDGLDPGTGGLHWFLQGMY
jgi:protein ImuB